MGANFLGANTVLKGKSSKTWSAKDIKWPKQRQVVDDLLQQPGMADIVPSKGVGKPPEMVKIDKTLLFIEPSYQRLLNTRASLKLIRTMVEAWSWNVFVPPRVSPRDDGLFSVIDGGHTTRAAWLIPEILELPCLVGEKKTIQEQAAAFIELNTARVAMNKLALFHAAATAGDEQAVAAKRAAEAAGVTILPAPTPIASQKIGDTVAWKAVQLAVRDQGEEATVIALRCLKEAWVKPGQLMGDRILAASMVVRRVMDEGEAFDYTRFLRVLRARDLTKQAADVNNLQLRTGATHAKGWFMYWKQAYDKAR